ncbi:MAG: heme exporter protein CcmB [Rhodospirillaceae bacterium]|nr:heme exporter protein CcmB [Rhodospirillaceae bacterium]MDE0361786.1 heme exporter protein CcmB [Rhodospirillaceae bacterium]
MLDTLLHILRRDLRLAFRRWSELATPLIFFVIIASLFPLAATPDEAQLRSIGAAVIWMSALLSSLLALDGLFRADTEDGSMEQLILAPAPLGLVVLGKIVAHWAVSGVPLLVLAPLVAMSFYLPLAALPELIAALALATPTLSVLAAIGAALTVSLRAGGTIIGLLILPLTGPVLIFGARATELAALGESVAGPLYLLASLAVLAVSLGPLVTAAAVRAALE